MNEPEDDRRSQVALQRYEVIAPLLNRPLPSGVSPTTQICSPTIFTIYP
jgi:hypothetical protein